ncbi:unnamed protein product [Cylindrotheca closterium]|uniref:Uncharacterized protein n=1 Tax=Cylindrotheca closterium TaxID=2856 RepID=A0AAD2GA61_9STRA|nr:unnamed protein product [Cylindrotheca closterium]
MQENTLRWRSRAPSPDTPQSVGYIEDYGDDSGSVKSTVQTLQFLWAFKHYFSINCFVIITIIICTTTVQMSMELTAQTASALTILVCFILLIQRRTAKKLGTLRHQHNEIRRKIHYFRQENERLHRNSDRLDETVANLQHIPKMLHEISKNKNVDQLVSVIKRHKLIQEQIRQKVNEKIIQNIMTIVVGADRDSNWSLKPEEVDRLVQRLSHVEEITLNERRFREMIGPKPHIGSVMRVIRSLLERDDEYALASPCFKMKGGEKGGAGETVFTV